MKEILLWPEPFAIDLDLMTPTVSISEFIFAGILTIYLFITYTVQTKTTAIAEVLPKANR